MDLSTCTPQELTLLDDFLSIADAQGFGIATGEAVAAVLHADAVGLDLRVLADIWALCDPEFKGFLERAEVAALLRIVGWVQEGAPLSADLVYESGPCAVIVHPLMPHREREFSSETPSPPAAAKGKQKEDPNQPFQPLSLAEMEIISQTTHDPLHCERAMRSLMDCFNQQEEDFDPDLTLQGLNVLTVCLGTGADQVGNYWRIHLESFSVLIQTVDDIAEATPQIVSIRQRLVEIIELLLDEQKLANHRTTALRALETQPRDQPGLSPVADSGPSQFHGRPASVHQNSSDLRWEEDQAYDAALRRITHGQSTPSPSATTDRLMEASRIASEATGILDLLKVRSERNDDNAALEEALKASKLALEANRILIQLHEQNRAAAEDEELELALRLSREEGEKNSYRYYDSSRTPSPWQRPSNSQTSSYFPNDVKEVPSPFDDLFAIANSPEPSPILLPATAPIPPLPPTGYFSPPSSPTVEEPTSPLRRESSSRGSIPVPSPPRIDPTPSPPWISVEDSSNPHDQQEASPSPSAEQPASLDFMDTIPHSHSRQPSPPSRTNSHPVAQPSHEEEGALAPDITRRAESPAVGDEPPPPYDPGY